MSTIATSDYLNQPDDPVPLRLVDEVNGGETDEDCRQVFADTVATTAAGILAQLRVLRDISDIGDTWSDERDCRLLASIVAGVERLAAGAT